MTEAKVEEVAKQTTKIKRTFLGVGLPNREIPLNFVTMSMGKRSDKPVTSLSRIYKEFRAIKELEYACFEKAVKDLKDLNNFPMNAKTRYDLSRAYWHKVYATAIPVMKRYETNGQLPDDTQRADVLDMCFEALSQVLRSYQLVFMHDYELSNLQYEAVRERVHDVSFRMVEIVQLQQQVGAYRYRPLPMISWYIINKIYHVMREYEVVDLKTLLTRSLIKVGSVETFGTLEENYLKIQLCGYFDPLRYKTHQQHLLNSYIRHKLKNLAVQPYKAGDEVPANCLLIGNGDEKPPASREFVSEDIAPGTIISLRPIIEELAYFHKQISEPNCKLGSLMANSPAFRKEHVKDRISIFKMMYERVARKAEVQVSYSSKKPINLLLYSGYIDCYDVKADDKRAKSQRKVLREALAERSAAIGIDEESEVQSLWYTLYQDAKSIWLQTQETRYTNPMCIGSLVCYSQKGQDERMHTFASVSRIERIGGNQVVLEMRVFAAHAEAVHFYESDSQHQAAGDDKKYPALLTNTNGRFQMIIHNNHLRQRETVELLRDEEKTVLELGNLLMATHEFSVFKLQGENADNLGPLFQDADNMPHRVQRARKG